MLLQLYAKNKKSSMYLFLNQLNQLFLYQLNQILVTFQPKIMPRKISKQDFPSKKIYWINFKSIYYCNLTQKTRKILNTDFL